MFSSFLDSAWEVIRQNQLMNGDKGELFNLPLPSLVSDRQQSKLLRGSIRWGLLDEVKKIYEFLYCQGSPSKLKDSSNLP